MSDSVEEALEDTEQSLDQGAAVGDDNARVLAAEVRRLRAQLERQSAALKPIRKMMAQVLRAGGVLCYSHGQPNIFCEQCLKPVLVALDAKKDK